MLDSEARLRNIIEKNADGIIIVDQKGKVCFVNPAVESFFGRKAEGLVGELFGFPVVAGETAEVDIVRKGGERIVAEMRVVETEWDGEKAYLASLRDITERKLLLERIDYLARYDTLTGLPNRILFNDRLRQAIARAQRKGGQVAVLVIYLSGINRICEIIEHEVCNNLIMNVAKRLTDSVRRSDSVTCLREEETDATVSRVGEHDFAVLLQETKDAQDAAKVARRILDALSQGFVIDGKKFTFVISVGISLYPLDGDRDNLLFKNAFIAMSNIRGKGESNFQFYSPTIGSEVAERLAFEGNLLKALEQKNF